MPGSSKSKPSKGSASFVRPSGFGALFLAAGALSLALGLLCSQTASALTGAAFLTLAVYAYLALTISSLVNASKCKNLRLDLPEPRIIAGSPLPVRVHGKAAFLPLPAVLVRCSLSLETKDKRKFFAVLPASFFKTGAASTGAASTGAASTGAASTGAASVTGPKRGAFLGNCSILFTDSLGLFFTKRPCAWAEWVDSEKPLLVFPVPASPAPPLPPFEGTSQNGPAYLHGEEFRDHRPYLPGDDVRRINWKLYSHSDSLFVREDELVPPPSRVISLHLDTEKGLTCSGRAAVDRLCEEALAICVEAFSRGIRVNLSWTGQETPVLLANANEAAAALALPYSSA